MNERFYIGGKHAVISALNNPKREVHELFLNKNDKDINFLNKNIVDKKFFNKIFSNINLKHQNIAALVSPLKMCDLKDEIKNNLNKVVILNGISDQRNIGSIMRTVLAMNFNSIILEKKFFNQKNSIMIKAASGAIEHLKIFLASNIKNEIKTLKKNDFYIFGLDSNAKDNIVSFKNLKKYALIFGSENKGINDNVLRNCDQTYKIPMNKKIKSLNVSNAVAATLGIISYMEKLNK